MATIAAMEATALRIEPCHVLDEATLQGLSELLLDAVEGGASVSFMHPLPLARARAFWQGVAEGAARGERVLLVARDGEAGAPVLGTVQLVLAQPDNQPHRADVAKMLVLRRARRRGIGEALMRAAEAAARSAGKTLLVLDTASADAERLYQRCGWVQAGRVPGYALLPQGGLCDTVFYYRQLG